MKPFIKTSTAVCVLALSFLNTGCTKATITGGALIKGSASNVYYVDQNGRRYTFPNQAVYSSWYQDTNQSIIKVSNQDLAVLPLTGNVTIRPGSYLVKINTDSKVYAVSTGGYLHWVTSENIAQELYGSDWNKQVIDIPDVFFDNYSIGTPIYHPNAYNKNDAMRLTNNIGFDLQARNHFTDDEWMGADEKKSCMH